jgi:protein-disulfide isomerase
MICIIALIVFSFLAIFSARYKHLAKEAFECVFLRVTLRKCQTGLDQRLKAQITGKILKHHIGLGRFVYKYFEVFSWLLVILMLASLVYTFYGGYNYILYGNCNGPSQEGFCIFDPTGSHATTYYKADYNGPFVCPTADDDPSIGNKNANVTIIEFGCYECPFTLKAEPVIREIIDYYGNRIYYVYRDFPIEETHIGSIISSEAANCAREQDKFWEYHYALFENHAALSSATSDNEVKQVLQRIAENLSMDMMQFNACLDSEKYKEEVLNDFYDGIKAKIKGTPTFFINGKVLAGPKSFNEFKKVIDKELG